MATPIDTLELHINIFRDDLLNLPPMEIIRKYITTGSPLMLSEDEYFSLRNEIASAFHLHPSAIILVGSSRTGFSMKPEKRYQAASHNSDLDVAIVSSEKFDDYWERVFEYAQSNSAWKNSYRFRMFQQNLFRGWIDPRGLPPVKSFQEARHWTDFFDSMMQSRRFGTRRISARLYRTWSRLEAYQEKAVRQCIANQGAERHA